MVKTGLKASTLILCERLEIGQFMQVYFKHLQQSGVELSDFQMFNFNTMDRLDSFLNRLEASSDLPNVRKVLFLADVGHKLHAKELAIMRAENRLNKHEHLSATYYLFPGLRPTKHWEFGYLEDALLVALRKDTDEASDYFNLRNMADDYLVSVENNRGKTSKFSNRNLNLLMALFAGTEKYVGMRIAEAASSGAFDLDHPVFAPLRKRIEEFLL